MLFVACCRMLIYRKIFASKIYIALFKRFYTVNDLNAQNYQNSIHLMMQLNFLKGYFTYDNFGKFDKFSLKYFIITEGKQIFAVSRCSRILVLTGAGVSVSCGIPDFRSRNGVYARLHVEYPDLPDPTAMFDINYFSKNPKPFFEFARVLSYSFLQLVFVVFVLLRQPIKLYGASVFVLEFGLTPPALCLLKRFEH